MPYGIILLFDDALAAAVTGYAAALAPGPAPQMVLGPEAPPHVTLAHATCSREVALRWWERCALPSAVRVRLTGTMVAAVPEGDYYVPAGGVYAGLEAARDPELELAHRVVTGTAREVGADLLGAVDERFRPHVTLAVLRAGPVSVTPHGFGPGVVLRPALGRVGPFGTFPEILARR